MVCSGFDIIFIMFYNNIAFLVSPLMSARIYAFSFILTFYAFHLNPLQRSNKIFHFPWYSHQNRTHPVSL